MPPHEVMSDPEGEETLSSEIASEVGTDVGSEEIPNYYDVRDGPREEKVQIGPDDGEWIDKGRRIGKQKLPR